MTAVPPPPPRLLPLAAPLFVELLLGIGVGVAATALAARAGPASAAALSLALHVFGTLFIVLRIVGAGIGVVVTQALGAGRRERADRLARAALAASTALGTAVALAAGFGADALLTLLQAPPDVRPLAAPLLPALAPAMLLDAWTATMTAVLRAHLRVREALWVTVAMQLVHLALMLPLMAVPGSTPAALGLTGFAVALLASRVLALALLVALWRSRLRLVPRLSDLWRPRADELRAIARIGVPGAAENIAWRLAFTVSVAVVGTLGSAALAVHAYTMQVMMVVLLFGLATGLAAEVLVGHLVGAGRLREADRLVRRALARGLLVSVAVAGSAALAAPWLLRLFTDDAALVAQAGVLLAWTVLLEPGRTFNLVLVNALRAAGDARFPVAAGAASMAIVLAGGSWLLGSDAGLGLGLPGVWIAYAADEWLRGLLMWARWRGRGWLPHARRARRHATAAASG